MNSLVALVLPSWCCWNSAAKLVLLEQRCQVGDARTALPNLQQVGHDLPYLQQVWFIYTKLAANMAVQAILGAFLAVLGSMIVLARSSRFIVGLLKLSINGCLQIRRQAFCFSCAFHMRQQIGTKLDVYG
ncbi:hypothetical protein [Lancefieldella rimae]|uniref:hypothetical protein n=1 Tax=Lancefieldella rimae TaxID=1383 RepID=UPI002880BB47|nr:hypothetical protein [Lancefieldella rimae]